MGWRPDPHRMPSRQKPDGTVAGGSKRLALRFCQLKTGHCLAGQYLHWAKNRPATQCLWCRNWTQTRSHLFKVCPEWKARQKILWAEVRKGSRRGKSQFKIRDLLADRRCSQAVRDVLATTRGCVEAGPG